jgi:hypothetical protein
MENKWLAPDDSHMFLVLLMFADSVMLLGLSAV